MDIKKLSDVELEKELIQAKKMKDLCGFNSRILSQQFEVLSCRLEAEKIRRSKNG